MAFSIAKAANWLHQVHRARAVVGWWPEQFALEDERTAYKVQDALLNKLVPEARSAGRLQDRAHLAADLGADRPARSGLRADPQEARVRTQGLGARRPVGAAWR